MSGPQRRRQLWPWLLLLLLLVGAGIALAYFLTRDDDTSSSADSVPVVVGRVDVPKVVGLDLADASERVRAAGLRARSVQVSARQTKGRVIRQRPPAEAEARRGATVVLTVSKGPQLAAVPAVVGQKEADATSALRRVGLRVKIVPVPAPGPLPEGVVVAQAPKGGARAPQGSTVRLNISTGGPATGGPAAGGSTQTVPTTGEATVPNVVGSRDTDASARLQAAGFRVTSTAVSSTRPPGTVLTQSPAGGTGTTRGSAVRITVSGGRQVRTVPNVIGETEPAADAALRDAGFSVRVVDRPVTDPAQNGLVVEQDPRAGIRVQGTTRVTVYVGRSA